MKILHFSDSHLWIGLENTSREEDFYDNFEKIIDEILFQKPDIVLHTGDLFHTSKPSNKAISVVVENFLKLQKANIPVVIIAWNHDTPRLSTTTHPFEIFQSMENMKVFYKWELWNIQIEWVNFVCLPHIHDEIEFKKYLLASSELLEKNMPNVFLSHLWISAKEYEEYTDEISWVNITLKELEVLKQFDYVALWHYHKQFCIGNMCYPGSWEHTSFNQKDYLIWYNIFDTETKKIEKKSLSTRPMKDLWIFDTTGIDTTQDLVKKISESFEIDALDGAIVKIILENLSNKLFLEFDEKLFLSLFVNTFYFEYKKFKKADISQKYAQNLLWENNIFDNFEAFFSEYDLWENQEQRKELEKEILDLLKKI